MGSWGEEHAQKWLEERGFEFFAKNYTTEYGEIDLIMRKADRLHFVEVKTRRTKRYGNPEDAVTGKKLAHMADSAQRFLQLHPEYEGEWQIDVIAVYAPSQGVAEIRWFENVA